MRLQASELELAVAAAAAARGAALRSGLAAVLGGRVGAAQRQEALQLAAAVAQLAGTGWILGASQVQDVRCRPDPWVNGSMYTWSTRVSLLRSRRYLSSQLTAVLRKHREHLQPSRARENWIEANLSTFHVCLDEGRSPSSDDPIASWRRSQCQRSVRAFRCLCRMPGKRPTAAASTRCSSKC